MLMAIYLALGILHLSLGGVYLVGWWLGHPL
jgi:hypothetical protein